MRIAPQLEPIFNKALSAADISGEEAGCTPLEGPTKVFQAP